MPRKQEDARLLWIKPKYDPKTGKLKSNGYWAIADKGKLRSTGCGADEVERAKKCLFEYQVEQYASQDVRERILGTGKGVREVKLADIISYYIERTQDKFLEKKPNRQKDLLNTYERLILFWGDKTVADIHEKTIKEYQEKARANKPLSSSHARRELEELKAMVNLGITKQLIDMNGHLIDWELPKKSDARWHFYSRSEVAKLLWRAWKTKNEAMGSKGYYTSRHIARFILIAVGTGTRADRIENASYIDYDDRPWMDLENGIFYRAGVANKSPLNKKAKPCRIPDDLLLHLKRWREKNPDTDNVIDYLGEYGSTRSAFYRLKKKALGEERAKKVNRHTFRHTCASWMMQHRVPRDIIANYLSITPEMVEEHYGHFHPDFHKEVNDARKKSAEERREQQREKQRAAKKGNLQLVA